MALIYRRGVDLFKGLISRRGLINPRMQIERLWFTLVCSRRLINNAVCDALDSVLEKGGCEVEEKAYAAIEEADVGEQLLLVMCGEVRCAFYFNDNLPHQQSPP